MPARIEPNDTFNEDWLDRAGSTAWLEAASAGKEAPAGRLLILQSTPYCNIDCSYCYLTNRDVRARMSLDTVRSAVDAVQADGLCGALTVLWHAGEPLVLSADYYREAFEAICDERRIRVPVALRIQTNATPLTTDHCELFREYHVNVGVSLDGPKFLHDANRQTRSKKGTHARVLAGIKLLQRHAIDPAVICVVTDSTLKHGRMLVEYFASLGVTKLSLNFEEVDGLHTSSSLQSEDLSDVETFLRNVYRASKETGVRVREFSHLAILASRGIAPDQQVTPFSIVSVDWRGNFSTFSPELLDLAHARHGHFHFGNVHTGNIVSASRDPGFLAVTAEIRAGVDRCRGSCRFFDTCGGGAPSNKLAELGTFDATETLSCRIRTKTVAKVFYDEASQSHEDGPEHARGPEGSDGQVSPGG